MESDLYWDDEEALPDDDVLGYDRMELQGSPLQSTDILYQFLS